MTILKKVGLLSIATFAIIGCGDSYSSDDNTDQKSENRSLTSLSKTVKFLTDTDGMTLYTFDKDILNKSNCDADCQNIWPLFEGANTTSPDIKTLEGTDHLAYGNHPLYYFANDNSVGDVNGDNVKNVWHLVYAPLNSTDTQTKLSEESMIQTYLTDEEGRALYTFDKDTDGVSNCYDACEELWPVYYKAEINRVPSSLKISDFSTISRDESQSKTGILEQTTYQGKPLYYFTPDAKKSGETKGDWVKGVWHLVEISAKKMDSTTTEISLYTDEARKKGKTIFTDPSKCSQCHGSDGQNRPLGVNNIIARYRDAKLIEQKLRDMRDNGNPSNRNTNMVAVAKKLSDEAITNLSAFIETLKK